MNRDQFKAKAENAWKRIKDSWLDDPLENAIIAVSFFVAGWFIAGLF